jgi:hypothetical protein
MARSAFLVGRQSVRSAWMEDFCGAFADDDAGSHGASGGGGAMI